MYGRDGDVRSLLSGSFTQRFSDELAEEDHTDDLGFGGDADPDLESELMALQTPASEPNSPETVRAMTQAVEDDPACFASITEQATAHVVFRRLADSFTSSEMFAAFLESVVASEFGTELLRQYYEDEFDLRTSEELDAFVEAMYIVGDDFWSAPSGTLDVIVNTLSRAKVFKILLKDRTRFLNIKTCPFRDLVRSDAYFAEEMKRLLNRKKPDYDHAWEILRAARAGFLRGEATSDRYCSAVRYKLYPGNRCLVPSARVFRLLVDQLHRACVQGRLLRGTEHEDLWGVYPLNTYMMSVAVPGVMRAVHARSGQVVVADNEHGAEGVFLPYQGKVMMVRCGKAPDSTEEEPKACTEARQAMALARLFAERLRDQRERKRARKAAGVI